MKRIKIEDPGKTPSFIGSWNIEPLEICDDLIKFFERNPQLHEEGKTFQGVNKKFKKSTDLPISPHHLEEVEYSSAKRYVNSLFECYEDYLKQWPFLKRAETLDIGSFNIQRYHKGEHFNRLHTERFSLANSFRLLAWMTYLNDVEAGGTTYFQNYDLKIYPKKILLKKLQITLINFFLIEINEIYYFRMWKFNGCTKTRRFFWKL